MTEIEMPSYRVRPVGGEGPPWRMIALGGGLAAVLVLGALIGLGLSGGGGGRGVPLIEADPRPFKIRPDDPGGLRVPNQDELIFERNRGSNAQPPSVRLAPEPEAPRLDALRAQVAQPPRPLAPSPAPATMPQGQPAGSDAASPVASAPPAASAQPAPTTPPPPAAARPMPVPNGRVRVQLGALTSEEAARAEWDRLARRHPDLLGAFQPQVVRFDREGQATLYRLRTGGFADVTAARAFCEQARARQLPCIVVR